MLTSFPSQTRNSTAASRSTKVFVSPVVSFSNSPTWVSRPPVNFSTPSRLSTSPTWSRGVLSVLAPPSRRSTASSRLECRCPSAVRFFSFLFFLSSVLTATPLRSQERYRRFPPDRHRRHRFRCVEPQLPLRHQARNFCQCVPSSRSPSSAFGRLLMLLFSPLSSSSRNVVVETNGNPACHVILRGSNSGPNYDAEHVGAAAERLIKAKLTPKVMVDWCVSISSLFECR
jgi:hypothetical protein